MKKKLVPIANSRGVRLPKPMIEEAGLSDEVEMHVRDGEIIITSMNKARAGWAEAAKALHDRKEDTLSDPGTETQFDMNEWKWRI
jgi:antitoxin MazE